MSHESNNGMTCPLEPGDVVQIVGGRCMNKLGRRILGLVTTVRGPTPRPPSSLGLGAFFDIDIKGPHANDPFGPWVHAPRAYLMKIPPPDEPEEDYEEMADPDSRDRTKPKEKDRCETIS